MKQRTAFGSPIASFQNTQFELAEMRTEIDVTQSFVDRCVEALNAGELTVEEAAEAKWWCTELQKRTVDRCADRRALIGRGDIIALLALLALDWVVYTGYLMPFYHGRSFS